MVLFMPSHAVSIFDKLVVATLPLAPKFLIHQVAKRYVAGEKLSDCLNTVEQLNQQGVKVTIDFLGEFISTDTEAHQTALAYKEIIRELSQRKLCANVSVKLSAFGLLINPELCDALLHDLCFYANEYQNFVRIDMEDSQCTEDTIQLYLKLRQQYQNTGIVLQAYLKRTQDDITRITQAGAGHFRLCKGIYIEPPEIAYDSVQSIRDNYLKCLRQMLSAGSFVGIATHDPWLVDEAKKLLLELNIPNTQYEFQMLLGVAEEMRRDLVALGHSLRVYVPYGYRWYEYSIRRLKENPRIARYVIQNLFS